MFKMQMRKAKKIFTHVPVPSYGVSLLGYALRNPKEAVTLIEKNFTAFLFVFLLAITFVSAEDKQDKRHLEVITTLFPTYDFAKQIGEDKVNVTLLLPPGVEPHAFEPRPADIVRINKADVFIYTGKFMEPWVSDMLKGLSSKNILVIDVSKGIELITEETGEAFTHKELEHQEAEKPSPAGHYDEEYEHGRNHGGKDPHIWLDLANAQIMVQTIASSFAEKDPGNKDFYLKNADEYKAKLAALDRRLQETFLSCKHKTLIYGGHFVFGYFAKRYGLEYICAYTGFSPDAEPTPKAIAGLIDNLRASGVRYIYYEELLDPKVARTIASETGAKPELLHAAHNISKDELNRGITFLNIMEDNLKKLKAGLECK